MTTSENHLSVKSLVQVFSEWEIQVLVLLSFTLQFFLFLVGGLRQRTTSAFLRFLIWLAYLGADVVAVYALGLLTQHKHATPGTPQLGLLWASFLLIHLGGQDTITAFAIEDNNLWRRHLLTLVVQATLVLYVFWKSIGGPNMQLLVASTLLFATGAIKYVERIWALWSGSLKRLASSTVPSYVREQWTPIGLDARYSDIVYVALHSIRGVRDVFGDIGFYHRSVNHGRGATVHPRLLPKLLEIELSLMFNDIYTKAKVLRTRRGIILRSVSLIFFLVGFVLFVTISNKERYNSNDTTITYALFIGGFSLEAYAIFITMMSPWTWAWLKNQQRLHPHGQCGLLVSINMWWQRRGMLWSNSMGQYNLLNYLGQYEQQSSMCKRRIMTVIRKAVNTVCGAYQKFWISKLLDTKFVEVDEKIMSCIVERIVRYHLKGSRQEWPNLRPLLEMFFPYFPFEEVIILLHVYTEVQLSRCSPAGMDGTLLCVCRKLSNYMLYLLVTHPEMLPVKTGSEKTLVGSLDDFPTVTSLGSMSDGNSVILHRAVEMLRERELPVPQQDCTEARLLEIQEAWTRLLIYAACKSRPEMHAAQLARGGELLTFAWLLTAHHLIGDLGDRIDIADILDMEEAKTVHIPAQDKLLYR